jgi:hypothetical protein
MPITKLKSKEAPPAKAAKSSKVTKGVNAKTPSPVKAKAPVKKVVISAKVPAVKAKTAPAKAKPAVKATVLKVPPVKAAKVSAVDNGKKPVVKTKAKTGEINVKATNKQLLKATKPVVIPPGSKYGTAKNAYGAGKEVVTSTLIGKSAAGKR